MSQVASEYARTDPWIAVFWFLSIFLLLVYFVSTATLIWICWSQQFEQLLKVFGSHPSIIKHWDKDCLKNDKLLTLSVVALCCWDTLYAK